MDRRNPDGMAFCARSTSVNVSCKRVVTQPPPPAAPHLGNLARALDGAGLGRVEAVGARACGLPDVSGAATMHASHRRGAGLLDDGDVRLRQQSLPAVHGAHNHPAGPPIHQVELLTLLHRRPARSAHSIASHLAGNLGRVDRRVHPQRLDHCQQLGRRRKTHRARPHRCPATPSRHDDAIRGVRLRTRGGLRVRLVGRGQCWGADRRLAPRCWLPGRRAWPGPIPAPFGTVMAGGQHTKARW